MGSYAAVISLEQTLNLISESDDFLSQSEKLCILDEMDSVLDKMGEIPSSKIVDAAAYERRVIDALQIFQHLIDSHLQILKEEITSFHTATDNICSSNSSKLSKEHYEDKPEWMWIALGEYGSDCIITGA
ncbi:hypothetical protein ABFS82_01G094300 [Erythranthe guttata]|uniref:uncharacterized protein LOC105963236 n=1 Tax=Erythranthe guttata TaxID=4155 RepID=UPI00064DC16D|nr:PREDICTED: uncharacterized protein LOC105963236 [Erythranthe guttata]|eukprot:XP_012843078.1 PREDICTED: uncharacterized protein LOC105963236 [Erythranthe guttata]